jgi:RNA polymerase sigma-70 factor (ECF subfamily)
MTDRQDASLIRAALAGDQRSLESLIRKYQNAVFAVAVTRTGDPAAAEEITADALVQAWQKMGQVRAPGRFAGWLRSMTLRLCAMWLRTKHRKSLRSVPLEEGQVSLVQATRAHDEPREGFFHIGALINALPPALKAAAVLCLQEEKTPADAAAILGIKPGTLRKRLHEARARLQCQIIHKAKAELRTELLPRDFAQRCVCRCLEAGRCNARKRQCQKSRKGGD